MTLPYYEVHDGEGPPLLMVHGILSSRAQWRDNLEALAEVCRPVILELFGHGRSPSPADGGLYEPAAYCDAFEVIREELGADKWFVLGYSLGAGLTMQYCLRHPEPVYAQMFTNSTSAFADASAKAQFIDNSDALIRKYESEGMSAIDSIPVHPRNAKRLPPHVKAELLSDCGRLNPAGVARTIVHTNGHSSIRDIIHANETPALLLCGAKETRFEPLKQFAIDTMPYLEVVDLPAGHAVNAEAPTEFNAAITAFIKKHRDLHG